MFFERAQSPNSRCKIQSDKRCLHCEHFAEFKPGVCVFKPGVCVHTLGVCVLKSGVCVHTSGVCVQARCVCVHTSRVCVLKSGVCVHTSGVCVKVRYYVFTRSLIVASEISQPFLAMTVFLEVLTRRGGFGPHFHAFSPDAP